MLNVDFTFVLTAINLVVLYLFLRKFLFGRVTDFMDKRNAAIEANIAKGEQSKAEGERYREEYQTLAKNTATERAQTMEAARQKATAHYDETVAEARAEANRIVAAAQEEAERERQRTVAQLRDEVASLALAAASKVMQTNMDSDKNRKLVDELLDDMSSSGGVA